MLRLSFSLSSVDIACFLCAMRVSEVWASSSSSSPRVVTTLVPNFISFAASTAELAHGEKSRTHSITHPAHLMPWEPERLHFGIKMERPRIKPATCRLQVRWSDHAMWVNVLFFSHQVITTAVNTLHMVRRHKPAPTECFNFLNQRTVEVWQGNKVTCLSPAF